MCPFKDSTDYKMPGLFSVGYSVLQDITLLYEKRALVNKSYLQITLVICFTISLCGVFSGHI